MEKYCINSISEVEDHFNSDYFRYVFDNYCSDFLDFLILMLKFGAKSYKYVFKKRCIVTKVELNIKLIFRIFFSLSGCDVL